MLGRILIIVLFLYFAENLYSQRDSSGAVVGDSKCGGDGMILDENGKAIINGIFITGKVYTDDSGKEPIENATVWIKGTRIGTVTNKKGLYGLNVTQINDTASSFVLAASFIGTATKEIRIEKQLKESATIDFGLKSIPDCVMPDVPVPKKK